MSSSILANLNASGIRSPNFARAELRDRWGSSWRTRFICLLYKSKFSLQSSNLFKDLCVFRSLQESYQDTASTEPTELVGHGKWMKCRCYDSYRAEGVKECDIETRWINAVNQVQYRSSCRQYFQCWYTTWSLCIRMWVVQKDRGTKEYWAEEVGYSFYLHMRH